MQLKRIQELRYFRAAKIHALIYPEIETATVQTSTGGTSALSGAAPSREDKNGDKNGDHEQGGMKAEDAEEQMKKGKEKEVEERQEGAPTLVRNLLVGQSFMVVLCTFIIAQLTTLPYFPTIQLFGDLGSGSGSVSAGGGDDSSARDQTDNILTSIFIRSGIPGVLVTITCAQLLPSMLAKEYPLQFANIPGVYYVIKLALLIESIGIVRYVYLHVAAMDYLCFSTTKSGGGGHNDDDDDDDGDDDDAGARANKHISGNSLFAATINSSRRGNDKKISKKRNSTTTVSSADSPLQRLLPFRISPSKRAPRNTWIDHNSSSNTSANNLASSSNSTNSRFAPDDDSVFAPSDVEEGEEVEEEGEGLREVGRREDMHGEARQLHSDNPNWRSKQLHDHHHDHYWRLEQHQEKFQEQKFWEGKKHDPKPKPGGRAASITPFSNGRGIALSVDTASSRSLHEQDEVADTLLSVRPHQPQARVHASTSDTCDRSRGSTCAAQRGTIIYNGIRGLQTIMSTILTFTCLAFLCYCITMGYAVAPKIHDGDATSSNYEQSDGGGGNKQQVSLLAVIVQFTILCMALVVVYYCEGLKVAVISTAHLSTEDASFRNSAAAQGYKNGQQQEYHRVMQIHRLLHPSPPPTALGAIVSPVVEAEAQAEVAVTARDSLLSNTILPLADQHQHQHQRSMDKSNDIRFKNGVTGTEHDVDDGKKISTVSAAATRPAVIADEKFIQQQDQLDQQQGQQKQKQKKEQKQIQGSVVQEKIGELEEGDRVKHFLLGRQLIVVPLNFIVAQLTHFSGFPSDLLPSFLYYLIIVVGLPGVLVLLQFAQLTPQLLAEKNSSSFMNMRGGYSVVYTALAIEKLGLTDFSWVLYAFINNGFCAFFAISASPTSSSGQKSNPTADDGGGDKEYISLPEV